MFTNLKLCLGLALLFLVLGLTAWGWVQTNRANNLATQVHVLKAAQYRANRALAVRDKALADLKKTKERTDATLSEAIRANPDWSSVPVPASVACSVRIDPTSCPSEGPSPGLPGQ